MGKPNQDEISDIFAQRSLRCTRQRRAVYQAILDSPPHPTAEQLRAHVQNHIPGISLSTIYNTLEAFCSAGIASRITTRQPNGSHIARYDLACDHHMHLRCRQTDTVKDLPDDLAQQLREHLPQHFLDEIQKQLGFEISHMQIEFVGEYKSAH